MSFKFFHCRLRRRRINNDLKGLHIDEAWCEDPVVVKKEAKYYFEARFTAKPWLGFNLDGVEFRSISAADNEMLCSVISEHEILEAIKQCGSKKSPDLDGYKFYFIKNNWVILGAEMISSIGRLLDLGYIPCGFITLVAKSDNPSSINDFRPISLVGCVYKVISKILANRIKRVLPSVIGNCQTAFLNGRGMLNSVLIANETVDFLIKEKSKGINGKVDYEKVYDFVDWNFSYYMMGRVGFNNKWVKWIKTCLESASVSIYIGEWQPL